MPIILGEGTLVGSETYVWVIQKTDRPDFGELIDLYLLNNEVSGLVFATKGVIQLNGKEVFVKRMPLYKFVIWKKKIRNALGMDIYLLGNYRDSLGKYRVDPTTTISLIKPHHSHLSDKT
jgi:hypothetical protein